MSNSKIQYVPVLDKNNVPLMSCHPARARQLLRKGKAVRRWFRGVFAIKLTEREGGVLQPIAVGVDPGSKREGFTVKSEKHTLLNIQTRTVFWVKTVMEMRNRMRHNRRKNTPYRQCRRHRSVRKGFIPPSTKARWQWKIRILKWLHKLYPISNIIIEDVSAVTKKGSHGWNKNFSPVQSGKKWFYTECGKIAKTSLFSGYSTYELRNRLGLYKSKDKLGNNFSCHCVDSWVMAYKIVGGSGVPENTKVLEIVPLQLHRRQLHKMMYAKGGVRMNYGGSRSCGFTRGSIVKNKDGDIRYIGGFSKKGLSLCDMSTGKRKTRSANPNKITFLSYNSWRIIKNSDVVDIEEAN